MKPTAKQIEKWLIDTRNEPDILCVSSAANWFGILGGLYCDEWYYRGLNDHMIPAKIIAMINEEKRRAGEV